MRSRTFIVILLSLLAPAAAHACSVCYGAPGTPAAHAMNNAIVFLLGVVGSVQAGFVALFLVWRRRAKDLRDGGVS